MSIVTGWGCACCLHTIVGEGRAFKEFLNLLPGIKGIFRLTYLNFFFFFFFFFFFSFFSKIDD